MRKCEDYAFRLKQLVESHYTQVDFNVAFQAPMTIGKMFPLKDNIKKVEERSMVIYKLKCSFGATYIGKTERILYYRINEHQDEKKDPNSACIRVNPEHQIDFKNIEVLDSADNDLKLRIKELIHIRTQKPELTNSSDLNIALKLKLYLFKYILNLDLND